MAKKLPKVDALDIWYADWKANTMIPKALIHLSIFVSVTALNLTRITFPNVLAFGRLIAAIPNLDTLFAEDVTFKSPAYNRLAFHPQHSKLRMLCLDGPTIPEIVDFLIDPAEILRSVPKITIGWYQPVAVTDLKDRRVKEMLEASGDSLENISFWLDGLHAVETAAAFDHIAANVDQLSHNTNLKILRLGLHIRQTTPLDGTTPACTWLPDLLSRVASKKLTLIQLWFNRTDLHRGRQSAVWLPLFCPLDIADWATVRP
ncbi:uncharacterized protein C8Q71DRAFT_126263 [Rhodofomes roseus]|uniref:Uncharacterized protein n=1 Tax=Rhodofomes roseus TaxID=34475 RepID=A0ABQ8KB83_9APHY|nr:uncharacterized protein C8Q71DRAFT_126263 [Rhodofomes roseus]KAH9834818.1 hypothetical protein C8Q71DRAFT_126263 [Rhodofomes roseus]